MSGWQRFFLLIVCSVGLLVLWPDYGWAGLRFLGAAFVVWTLIIILLSVFINIFAIYKVEFLHRILSLAFLAALVFSLLNWFPLEGGSTPLKQITNNHWPTLEDAKRGMQQLTFNFDFVRRNVHRDANYINQKFDDSAESAKETKQTVTKAAKKVEEVLELIEVE